MDNYFKENFCCNIDYLIPYIIEGLKKDHVPAFLSFDSHHHIKYVRNFDIPQLYYNRKTSQFCLHKKLYYIEDHLKSYFKRHFCDQTFLKPDFFNTFLNIHGTHTYSYTEDGCTFECFNPFKFDYDLIKNFIENHKNIENF